MTIKRRKQAPTVGDISADAVFRHAPGGHIVYGTWVFRSRAPLEIVLRLNVGRRAFVEWVFARNSLDEAIAFPGPIHGTGDVRMQVDPFDDSLSINLRSPSGGCVLLGSMSDAYDFLASTCDMIPICDNVDETCNISHCQEHELIWQCEEQIGD